MRILALGDVMGKGGRRAVIALTPGLRSDLEVDYVIANGENAAAGRGTTEKIARALLEAGVDVITGGNHTWAMRDFGEPLQGELPVMRPANYPEGAPGSGVWSDGNLTVLNLIGRAFMEPLDDPFAKADSLLEELGQNQPIVVDFHAEATSEKQAFGWHLDGRVAAVFGTHTHVSTADARLLPHGTAFITDLGMCGARDSIIGTQPEAVLSKFRSGLPTRLPPQEEGVMLVNGALITIDDKTYRASSIERISRTWEPD